MLKFAMRVVLLVAVIMFFMQACSPARKCYEYSLTGPVLQTPVYMTFGNANEVEIEALKRAADTINRTANKQLIVFIDRSFPLKPTSSIVFERTNWPFERYIEGITIIGHTMGWILTSEIHINSVNYVIKTEPDRTSIDMETLLLHELSHALGLDHQGDGVMSPYLEVNSIKRTFNDSEKAAFQCLYGTPGNN